MGLHCIPSTIPLVLSAHKLHKELQINSTIIIVILEDFYNNYTNMFYQFGLIDFSRSISINFLIFYTNDKSIQFIFNFLGFIK